MPQNTSHAQARDILTKLPEKQGIDDSQFADVIYQAISQWGLPEQAFRDAFGLTEGAVQRWAMQQNLPQPDIRPVIVEWIAKTLDGAA